MKKTRGWYVDIYKKKRAINFGRLEIFFSCSFCSIYLDFVFLDVKASTSDELVKHLTSLNEFKLEFYCNFVLVTIKHQLLL